MAYQNVGTPRFYINNLEWLHSIGHPVMQIEIPSSSIYACFEEATSDYSLYINQYNMKNWLWDDYGNTTKSTNTESMSTGSIQPQKPNLGASIYLSDKYGEEAEVGGIIRPPHTNNPGVFELKYPFQNIIGVVR